MAPDFEKLNSSAMNSSILNGLDDNVTHILHQLGVKSDADIVNELCDLEITELSAIREYLFKASVDIVRGRIIEQGIPIGHVNIILRRRNKAKTLSEDILKLVLYVIEFVEIFPKDVLSMNGQYVDLNVSNCTEPDENGQINENGQYKKVLECLSDLTNKYDSLDRSHKELRSDYISLERSHAMEIQQIRDCIKSNKNNAIVPTTLDAQNTQNSGSSAESQTEKPADLSASSSIPPGQQSNNGSTHGSNSGEMPGEGLTGSNGSDLGSMGGPKGSAQDSSFSEMLNNAMRSSPKTSNNEQSQQKPVFIKRDKNKRLIDSSTSPGLVKISKPDLPRIIRKSEYKNTDSGDIISDYEYSDCSEEEGEFTLVKGRRQRKQNSEGLITGIRRETGVKVYVQNIHRKRGQSYKDIASNVKKYCSAEGVRVMNAFVIGNRVTDDTVGCQLTVPMRYFDTVIADRFWPSEVVCKRWESKTSSESDSDDKNNRSRSRSKQRNTNYRSRVGSANSSVRSSSGRRDKYSDHWNYDNETGKPGANKNGRGQRRGSNRSLSRGSRT